MRSLEYYSRHLTDQVTQICLEVNSGWRSPVELTETLEEGGGNGSICSERSSDLCLSQEALFVFNHIGYFLSSFQSSIFRK